MGNKNRFPTAARAVGYLLPVVVVGLLAFGYYVFVIRLCTTGLLGDNKIGQAVGYLIPFHILFLFALICYIRVVSRNPGHPTNKRIAEQTNDASTSALSLHSMTHDTIAMPMFAITKREGTPRYCERCGCNKPDRCHHCSDCDLCVLKMDHHCPWVNQCVGFRNYKLFFLFVMYTALLCIFTFATSVAELAKAVMGTTELDLFIAVLCVVTGLFGLLLIAFTFTHLFYILLNKTTIEAISDGRPVYVRVMLPSGSPQVVVAGDQNLWYIGYQRNWKSVMGPSPWLWFIPVSNSIGDGYTYPYNPEAEKWLLAEAERVSQLPPPLQMVEMPEDSQRQRTRPDGGEESDGDDEAYARVF
ncbi:uncharacterized protein VTP21DRAFT_6500 [Calcarisporiella thermophila]|uniref:uncharacterized protein n=1 Tax=Calcarisporiella thermophila TaxID=911321 RepID=UPI0037423E85